LISFKRARFFSLNRLYILSSVFLIEQIVVNSFFYLASISRFNRVDKLLVPNIVVDVRLGWPLHKLIFRVNSLLHKIVFLKRVRVCQIFLICEGLSKLLRFQLIRIMLHDHKSVAAFRFLEKFRRVSLFIHFGCFLEGHSFYLVWLLNRGNCFCY